MKNAAAKNRWDERVARFKAQFGESAIVTLRKARIAMVGLGALGGHLVPHFAMLNVEEIILIDPGVVSGANLGNQSFDEAFLGTPKVAARAAQIARINPSIRVTQHYCRLEDLGAGALRDADLVVSGLDSLKTRVHLNETLTRLNKPWVDAAIEGDGTRMYGRVASFAGTDEACFICSFDGAQLGRALAARQAACPSWLAASRPSAPTLSASAECAVVAGIQSVEAINRLLGKAGRESFELQIHLAPYAVRRVALKRNARCLQPHLHVRPLRSVGRPGQVTLGDAFRLGAEALGAPEVTLRLYQKRLVTSVSCPRCGGEHPLGRMDGTLMGALPECPCGGKLEPTAWNIHSEIDRISAAPFLERTLREIGLPDGEILTARAEGRCAHLLVA